MFSWDILRGSGVMSLPGAVDLGTDAENDLHRFFLKFRPTEIVVDITLGLVFVALRVWPLVVLFMVVAGIHFCMMLWGNAHPDKLAPSTPWMWFVILAQLLFTVAMVGAGAGFQFYMIASLPVVFCNMRWPLSVKILQTTLIALFYIACDVVFPLWNPVYPLDPHTTSMLHELNVIGTCAITALVSYTVYLTIKQAEQRLRRLANTDVLTGLLNRRRITESIDKEHARCMRGFRPLSLIICDIDYFKKINDRYGHDVGDQVLKSVGKIFNTLRGYDSVARWGGEEFIVMLPDTDHVVAMKVAERLRIGVEESIIIVDNAQIPVTMTFGVAQVEKDEPWQSALARADKALYRGKECGRNRVMPYP